MILTYLFFMLLGFVSSLYYISKVFRGEVNDYFNLQTKINVTIKNHVDDLFSNYDAELKKNLIRTRDLIEDYMDDINVRLKSMNDAINSNNPNNLNKMNSEFEIRRASP